MCECVCYPTAYEKHTKNVFLNKVLLNCCIRFALRHVVRVRVERACVREHIESSQMSMFAVFDRAGLALFFVQFFDAIYNFADIVVVLVVVVAVIVGSASCNFRTFTITIHHCLAVRRFVRFLVEIVEQEVEEDGIGQCEADRPAWIATFRPQQLRRMNECQTELNLKTNERMNICICQMKSAVDVGVRRTPYIPFANW